MKHENHPMCTWTLVSVGVAALAVLLGGETSWGGVVLAARIGFAALVVAALLVGVRTMTRQMALPPESAGTRTGAPTRRPNDLSARALGRAAQTRAERRSAAVTPRTLGRANRGEIR